MSSTSCPVSIREANCRSSINWHANSRFATIGSRRFPGRLGQIVSSFTARPRQGGRTAPSLRTSSHGTRSTVFQYENGSIFDALHVAGHRYRLYNDNHNRFSDDASGPEFGGWISQVASLKGVSQFDIRSIDNFASDLQKPDYTEFYTFIEPNFGKSFFARQPWQKGIAREDLAGPTYKGGSSQHPEDDPSGGEGLIKAVYEAIRRSPVWNTSLLVIVYDEHGGFYDSVKPGRAVPPGDLPPRGQPALNSRGFD